MSLKYLCYFGSDNLDSGLIIAFFHKSGFFSRKQVITILKRGFPKIKVESVAFVLIEFKICFKDISLINSKN